MMARKILAGSLICLLGLMALPTVVADDLPTITHREPQGVCIYGGPLGETPEASTYYCAGPRYGVCAFTWAIDERGPYSCFVGLSPGQQCIIADYPEGDRPATSALICFTDGVNDIPTVTYREPQGACVYGGGLGETPGSSTYYCAGPRYGVCSFTWGIDERGPYTCLVGLSPGQQCIIADYPEGDRPATDWLVCIGSGN